MQLQPEDREGPWVAIQVLANAEKATSLALRRRNYEEFLPTYTVRRRRSDRMVALEVPLFPGYLFCRCSSHNPHLIVQVPGVVRIVGMNRIPATLDQSEIDAVRRIVDSNLVPRPWKYLSAGEAVRIIRGALRGVEGLFVEQNNTRYVVLRVTVLQRAVAVQVRPEDIVLSTGVDCAT